MRERNDCMRNEGKPLIVKPVSLSEQAYQIIKEEIITNKIKAGEILTEEQLASELQISRTPIRTALKQLVMEHLATVNENKNVVVSNVTEQDVRNVSTVRMVLEPLAVKLIEDVTDKQIKDLRRIIKSQRDARSHEEFLRGEHDFHTHLAALANNTFLYDMIERTNIVVERYLVLSGTLAKHSSEAVDEHERIVDCLEAKDFKGAKQALEEHLLHVEERMFV